MPAAYLPSLIDQLRQEAEQRLRAHHLAFQRVESFGAPRRLVLIVHGLEGVQRKPGAEVRGPSQQAAFDESEQPTQALEGFLRSQGGTLENIKIVQGDKGAYVYLVKPPKDTPTVTVLPALLAQIIAALRAPKTMRWDASGVRFARPIRWLLALYDAISLPVKFGALTSAPATWLGQPKRFQRVPIRSIAAYHQALKRAGVILDPQERRARIHQMVERVAQRSGACIAPEMLSYGLLDEVVHLAERPVELSGGFDPAYVALPRDVLLASMAKHQRVFAIERDGTLLPQCVAVLEGPPGKPAAVRQVIERILNARLADSLLFWNADRRTKLVQRDLSGVTFHEKLGSMKDKTQRLHTLSGALAKAWNLAGKELEHLQRACFLAKADLVTTMVKEFPTLQGVMGKYYALESGEPQPVAEAIGEQYLPMGDHLPSTTIGQALAILDKYDTLAGYFSAGIEPTGDQDPFGLRRAAQGIVEVAWAAHRPLSLTQLWAAWDRVAPVKPVAQTPARVQRYIFERLYTFAWPAPAPTADCIDAVLGSPCDDLVDAMDRMVSLQQLSGDPNLLRAAKVIERTRNILKSATIVQTEVDPSRLLEDPERRLWDLYGAQRARLAELIASRSYAQATTLYGDVFYDPVHEFFDRVMVNVPDRALQQNRLALMKAIHALYTERVADLSKLTVLQHAKEPTP